ncbi:MAG: response regulator transcription factor [Chloroflexi bacterium]|nr:response regulator transcription factor [Chloroflexota bacterium]
MPAENKSRKHILVVDDEPRMVRFIRLNLEADGYWVSEASDGLEALQRVREHLPDLVVLDVAMPGLDGFETLAEIRKVSEVPVIMLTVRGEEGDRIRGLELGADDYVTKPFSPRELASRIKAVLRRTAMMPPADRTVLVIDDDLSIDFPRHEVIVQGKRVKLRPTEWRLLYHLVNNAGWVMSHDTLLSKVWGHEYQGADHYVRLYITYLRQKIEPDPSHPKYIFTERGAGYRFVDFRRRQLPKPAEAE